MRTRIQTAAEEREFQSYVQALLGSGSSPDVLRRLADLEVPPPYRVRVKVVYSSASPEAVVDQAVASGRVLPASNNGRSYLYRPPSDRKASRVPFFVAAFEANDIQQNMAAIISVCRSSSWERLRRGLRGMYPSLVPVLLSQTELVQAAKSLRRQTGHEVRVRAFSAKERLPGGSPRARKSVREWTDEALDQVLVVVQDRQQVITSLDVEFFPRFGEHLHVKPNVTCKIRKDGELEVSGSFRIAFEAIALPIARAGQQKLHFFSRRGLRESDYQPRPLAIGFARPIFDDTAAVRSLVGTLTKYPHSIHAIAHGNPYAHLQITDLLDGSSFDVWAVPPDRVALMPGLKASEGAFERLVHYIFETFREGQIRTYGREERPLEAAF